MGILFAAIAGGSTLGGLTYGSRHWRSSERRAVPVLLGLFALFLGLLAVLLSTGTQPARPAAGAVPDRADHRSDADHAAGPARPARAAGDRLNEAQAFLSASNTAGAALGTAVAGIVIDVAGLSWSFGGAALGVGPAALVAWLNRRSRSR